MADNTMRKSPDPQPPPPSTTPMTKSPTTTMVSTGLDSSASSLPATVPIKTMSSIHSSLRVVTNPGELTPMPGSLIGGKWTPGPLRSPTSLLLSPLGPPGSTKSSSSLIKSESDAMSTSAVTSALLEASKDLQFDPRFLAEAWSQESPQSVYGPLGQSVLGFAGFSGFSPLAGSSPGGARLLSPMAQLHPSSAPTSQQQQSFTSHLQGPLLAMSPSGFYPPSVVIPASPHQLNPHLLSPLFASAMSPSGGLGVSQDMLSIIDPSTVFVPPNSPSSILRHLLPPIQHNSGTVNVKDLTLNELRPHFNKPMAIVAKELGVCITLMKKICRRNGLIRWPHRRIRSLVNRITSLQVIAGNSTGAEKKRFQSQIAALREELSSVIENPNEKSRKAQADAKARSPTSAGGFRAKLSKVAISNGKGDDDDDEGDDDSGSEDTQNENVAPQVFPSTRRQDKPASRPHRKTTNSGTKAGTTRPPVLTAATLAAATSGKRKERFRASVPPPPPIKIPRRSDNDMRRGGDDGRPSSTTSTGSGKRGSISSILC